MATGFARGGEYECVGTVEKDKNLRGGADEDETKDVDEADVTVPNPEPSFTNETAQPSGFRFSQIVLFLGVAMVIGGAVLLCVDSGVKRRRKTHKARQTRIRQVQMSPWSE